MANESYIWLTEDVQTVDPRGWGDTMLEVITQVPQLSAAIQEQELLDRLEKEFYPTVLPSKQR